MARRRRANHSPGGTFWSMEANGWASVALVVLFVLGLVGTVWRVIDRVGRRATTAPPPQAAAPPQPVPNPPAAAQPPPQPAPDVTLPVAAVPRVSIETVGRAVGGLDVLLNYLPGEAPAYGRDFIAVRGRTGAGLSLLASLHVGKTFRLKPGAFDLTGRVEVWVQRNGPAGAADAEIISNVVVVE